MTGGIRSNYAVEKQTKQSARTERNEMAGLGVKRAVNGLRLVHDSRKVQATELREATTGRPVAVPRIWAVAEPMQVPAEPVRQPAKPKVELAFYRKYTEAMLRRYMRLSTQVGRTPSLMGREIFRGSASHYTMTTFEDEVIFCVDVERCLAKLPRLHLRFLERIAVQGYTLKEAAPLLGLDFRRCHERYGHALDELTELFLAGRLLEPLKCCQDVEAV